MTQKEKVVAHVAEVIKTLGVKSVRMDDVASSLGMSKRTLYEMFGDKEELLYESIVYLMRQRQLCITNRVATCENMLVDFAARLKAALPAAVTLHSLRLHETATSYAEWYNDEN